MPEQMSTELPSLSELLQDEVERYFIPVITERKKKNVFQLIHYKNPEAAEVLYNCLQPRYNQELNSWEFGLSLPVLYGLSGAESDRIQRLSSNQQKITKSYLSILSKIAQENNVSLQQANDWFQQYEENLEAYQKIEPYIDQLNEIDGLLQEQNLRLKNSEVSVILEERLNVPWKDAYTVALPTSLLDSIRDYIEGERTQWSENSTQGES